MAIIALKCPQIKVTVVDLNADRIAAWNSDNLPIFEPGLHEVVMQTRGKNLFFTTDVEKGIEESDMIFLSVNVSVFVVGLPSDSHKDVRYRCWKRGEPALSVHLRPRYDHHLSPERLVELCHLHRARHTAGGPQRRIGQLSLGGREPGVHRDQPKPDRA